MEGEATVSKNFIEQEIDKESGRRKIYRGCNPFSTRTKRISAYRTCQINSVKLWSCQGVWWNIPFPV